MIEYEKFCNESGRAISEVGLPFLFGNKNKVHYEKIECPKLIIVGKKDKITPYTNVRKIYNKYLNKSTGRVELIVLDNNAHWLTGEDNWEEIADHIYSWINKSEDEI